MTRVIPFNSNNTYIKAKQNPSFLFIDTILWLNYKKLFLVKNGQLLVHNILTLSTLTPHVQQLSFFTSKEKVGALKLWYCSHSTLMYNNSVYSSKEWPIFSALKLWYCSHSTLMYNNSMYNYSRSQKLECISVSINKAQKCCIEEYWFHV